MEKKSHTQKNNHAGAKVAAGATLMALAAAAAGAVYLYGTDAGKKKRKDISSWALRMKADVMDRMEKMKDWSEDSYKELIDNVATKYSNVKNIDKTEIVALAADLKKHWKSIKKQVETGGKKSAPRKKAVKKADTTSETK